MLASIAPSRRNFLVGLGRFAAASSASALLPGLAYAAGGEQCPPPSAWTDLARAVSGGVLRPEDPFFGDVSRPNNLRYNIPPEGIARCTRPEDVLACIRWVKKHDKKFAVRSGGHNYAGFSATSGLLIDMSLMAGVKDLGRDGLVQVAGGTSNALVYKSLERLGRTITHGRCDAVGAAGFLLGGGVGFNMRRYGVGSDLLQATDLVTADEQFHSANESHDRDLFWACRGGAGGNFGINTAFTLQTFPVDTVTVFNITWTKNLDKVLHGLLNRLPAAPDEFGSKISITMPSLAQRCAGQGISLSILGQLHKSSASLKDIIGPFWDMAETKVVKPDIPYWAGQDFLSEETYPYFYQEKSSYMMARGLNERAVGAMLEKARAIPGTAMPVAFKFFQVGGAINRTGPTDTAYVHRGYDWLFTVEMNWWQPTDPPAQIEANLAWQQDFYDTANKLAGGIGAYQNFSDPSLTDWQNAYYGQNYAKLRKVKKEVDPGSFFTFAQAIQPA